MTKILTIKINRQALLRRMARSSNPTHRAYANQVFNLGPDDCNSFFANCCNCCPSVVSVVCVAWFWVYSGDTPTSVECDICADNSGVPGSTLASLTVSDPGAFSYAGTDHGGFGFDVYKLSFSLSLSLSSGNYWLQFQNAVSSDSNPVFWDVSNGSAVGWENSIGNTYNQCGDDNTESCSFQIYYGSSLLVDNTNASSGTYYGDPGGVDCIGAWTINHAYIAASSFSL